MSPVYDFDKDKDLFSPIEFKIEEKTYKVKKISKKRLDEVKSIDGIPEQFAFFVGAKTAEIKDIDFRILTHCIKLIFDSFKMPFTAEVAQLTKLIKEKRTEEEAAKEPEEPEEKNV